MPEGDSFGFLNLLPLELIKDIEKFGALHLNHDNGFVKEQSLLADSRLWDFDWNRAKSPFCPYKF